MNAVTPVVVEIFGVARNLRATLGAKKMLTDEHGDGFFPKLLSGELIPHALYALMHDEEGNPPDVSIKKLQFGLSLDDQKELLAAIISAFSNGRKKKEEIEESLREVEEGTQKLLKERIGLRSSDSAPKDLESAGKSSGGDSGNVKLMPSSTPTARSRKRNIATMPSTLAQ